MKAWSSTSLSPPAENIIRASRLPGRAERNSHNPLRNFRTSAAFRLAIQTGVDEYHFQYISGLSWISPAKTRAPVPGQNRRGIGFRRGCTCTGICILYGTSCQGHFSWGCQGYQCRGSARTSWWNGQGIKPEGVITGRNSDPPRM